MQKLQVIQRFGLVEWVSDYEFTVSGVPDSLSDPDRLHPPQVAQMVAANVCNLERV